MKNLWLTGNIIANSKIQDEKLMADCTTTWKKHMFYFEPLKFDIHRHANTHKTDTHRQTQAHTETQTRHKHTHTHTNQTQRHTNQDTKNRHTLTHSLTY